MYDDGSMDSGSRLLRLLALLQSQVDWSGTALARRLGVSTRTVRSDVGRLRRLGYPVHATSGVVGGYRLGAGARLPPLVLDDEEAIAVAVGLRTAAAGTVGGIEETSLRALAKLEHVLPARLRPRVAALSAYTVPVPGTGPAVDGEVLATLASACRDRRRLGFDYRDHHGADTVRETEPHRLVSTGRRWYLVAWDLDRADWRTFRVDRLTPRLPTGPAFEPHPIPDGDIIAYVINGVASVLGPCRTVARVHAGATTIAELVPPVARVEHLDESTCLLHIGAATPLLLAVYLAALGVEFTVDGPPELLEQLISVSARCRSSARSRNRSCKHASASPAKIEA
ncbi:MAG: transcriptional regulator [Pseudonocardiaceae bacterium]